MRNPRTILAAAASLTHLQNAEKPERSYRRNTLNGPEMRGFTLQHMNKAPHFYSKGSYGWWVYVPDEDLISEMVPAELVACLAHARKTGCKWLCLDCDGDVINELQLFNG